MASDNLKTLVDQVASGMAARRRIPRATYRVQFNKDFTFRHAEALVPYLDTLGISHLYASPILMAAPGSMHGYDICDPTRLNPELGTPQDFESLVASLKARNMGMVIDIVPNHMGIASECNLWWNDVLENGQNSPYAETFDIDWNPTMHELRGKVLLPILGDQYGNVLEAGNLVLGYAHGAFHLTYGERQLPIAPHTYALILSALPDRLKSEDAQTLRSLLGELEQGSDVSAQKYRLAALSQASSAFRQALETALAEINGSVGDPQTFDVLDELLGQQYYRLAYWRVAGEEINYRRFFDVNTMAAIRTELPAVFDATHDLIFQMFADGQVDGLRIDHPDGLWDPAGYFRQLHEAAVLRIVLKQLSSELTPQLQTELQQLIAAWFEQHSSDQGFPSVVYVVAEKILSETEPLPLEWAVDGTTGYDFMNMVNSLLLDDASEARLSRVFADFTGRAAAFSQLEYASKKKTMQESLAGEINLLARRLTRISEGNRHTRDFTLNSLRNALREVVACLSIYRTYITGVETVSERDVQFVEAAIAEAKRRNPRMDGSIFDFIQDTWLLRKFDGYTEAEQTRLVDFVMRLQQITPPVMAKSVEDTLFYIYNRLVSVNEVGGNPTVFGMTPQEFGAANAERCRLWSNAMLATSTHDTKRSEDVRARINVLSELVDEWQAALENWARINVEHKQMLSSGPAPSANDEYLLYQTLLGTYQPDALEGYADRIVAYMAKAIKEAKVSTSWTDVNEAYDDAVEQFVRAVLESGQFIEAFLPLQRRVAYFGRFNSLAQTLLKLTCPGVPDTYRGTEVWDYSLVDPDNRRPVDYDHIRDMLGSLEPSRDLATRVEDLLANSEDGRIKLFVIRTVLQVRRENPRLFTSAPYQPLEAGTPHVCAFTRIDGEKGVLVIVPRLIATLMDGAEKPPVGDVWGEAALSLPDELAGLRCANSFTGEMVTLERQMPISALLSRFPVGLFQFDLKGV
jgi:(1->4)-alpha-D-glucan 1-alpha-D-glucosylmutase